MIDRDLPRSLDSEVAFLHACLYDPERAVEMGVMTDLKPTDFYRSDHGKVWKAMLFLFDRKQPIDVVTVANVLEVSRALDTEMSPGLFLSSLRSTGGALSANAGAYAQTIRAKSLMRRVIEAGGRIAQLGYEDQSNSEEVLDRVDSLIRSIRDTLPVTGRSPDTSDILLRMEDTKASGIPTRFPTLNYLSSGMNRKEIWVVGGFSSTGKSSIVVNLLEDVARAGGSAMVASAEMSQEQYLLRAMSITSGVAQHTIRHGGMTLEDSVAYGAARDFWVQAKVRVYDDLYSVTRIARKAQMVKRDIGLDVLFVDYLQNLSQTADETNDVRVAVIELQKLAKELDCCVIALSQISNEEAKRMAEQGMGNYYGFKGSGAIKDVADFAIMLERDRVNKPGVMWFHIAKNRHDQSGVKFAARYDLATGCLTQMSDEEQHDADPNSGRRRRGEPSE